ncbi:amidohydrolase [Exiguobacterium sp. SH31]|uniref:amidohydrolase n=1 Tax=Exiguobacterium sp. SH31 TaxID=1843183 RepID=UPI0008D7C6D2|nr:amidohydrolase [Exiguobacterium sp. SH31]OGX80617.1 amidohydrolase [Exiguobacterium sp. SH31]
MTTNVLNWFEHFHAHPEVSWKEEKTTKTIADILASWNVRHETFDDVTGVIAEIGTGANVIAVRADIDALWQQVDGEFRANHSCGHDANISMVLGALELLKDEALSKRIRFIFQPAEEQGNGSLAMINKGALDDVSHLYGIHLRPLEELKRGQYAAAIQHGAALFLKGRIIGDDAHGARPHQGQNALDVVFTIQQMLKSIYLSPFEPHSIKLTGVQAGSDNMNIIPGNATFSIDVRAQQNKELLELRDRLETILHQISVLHGVEIELEWQDFTPGAEIGKHSSRITAEAIIALHGEDALVNRIVTSGSDDFHFYTVEKPGLDATMIGIGANLTPGLHHPQMTFDRDVLPEGAALLAETLRRAVAIR